MQLLTVPIQECPAGQQIGHVYRVTNNTAFTATLLATASSGQNGRLPESSAGSCLPPGFDSSTCNGDASDDPCCSITSFSNPVSGDELPIGFLEDLAGGVLPFPADPGTFVQPDITKNIVLAPAESRIITIAMLAHQQCLDGSCSEQLFKIEGTLNDGNNTPVIACAGGALNVNSATEHVPFCGNGIIEDGEWCEPEGDDSECPGGCKPDCTCDPATIVPAVSDWGLVAMTLLVLTAATVVLLRRRAVVQGGDLSA